MIRVLLVDDQRIVTTSLRTVLELEDDFVVVGEAVTQSECVEQAAAARPDVVVTEIQLSEGNGIDAAREIASRGLAARVLVLTSDEREEMLFAAIRAGALGYLLKRSRCDEVARGIRLAAEGQSVIDPRMAAGLPDDRPRGSANPFEGLTDRERLVLAGVASGMTSVAIGLQLHFSERTIKKVVSQAMVKIGATCRSEAAALFIRHAMVKRQSPVPTNPDGGVARHR